MYSGSSYDSGQMDSGQLVCRPAVGPTLNWLDSESSYQQRRQKEDGQPVSVRVMTNGTVSPSERSDNYVRPFGGSQQPQPPTSPSHLAFLYDRAQQPKSPSSSGTAACADGSASMTSPHPDGYRPLSRAVPAPVQLQQQQQPAPTTARTSTGESTEYNAFSRATPAPIQQHAAQRPAAATTSSADAATPTSPRTTQHVDSEQSAAQVTRQLSQLSVADGQRQHSPRETVVAGSGPAGSRRAGRVARQPPPPSAFTRRLSAPGPTGQVSGEPGSRKPWSYTPSFGVGCATGRVAHVSSRPIMHPPSHTGTNAPRVGTAEGLQPKSPGSDAPPRKDAVDSASIRYKLREGEDTIADYDETSIRYRGRANPSKTFRLLQSATGSDSDSDSVQAYATAGRRRRQPSKQVQLDDHQQQQPPPHADDIVDISYVGANIPSRTFRILQEAVGVTAPQENGGAQWSDVNSDGVSPGSRRNVRVIHLRPTMKKYSSIDNILAYSDL